MLDAAAYKAAANEANAGGAKTVRHIFFLTKLFQFAKQ